MTTRSYLIEFAAELRDEKRAGREVVYLTGYWSFA
jgi:hypothetical protein